MHRRFCILTVKSSYEVHCRCRAQPRQSASKCWAARCSSVATRPCSSAVCSPHHRSWARRGWCGHFNTVRKARARWFEAGFQFHHRARHTPRRAQAGGRLRLVLSFPPAAPCAQFATAKVWPEPSSCDHRITRVDYPRHGQMLTSTAASTARPLYPSALHASGARSDAHAGPRPASCIHWPDTHGRTRQ
jgi:hypothetical protein